MPEYIGDSLRASLFTVTGDEMVAFEGILDSSGVVPFHEFHLVETDSTGEKVTTAEYRDYTTLTSGVYFVRIVTSDSTFPLKALLLN